jgi:death-on-curing protein
MNHAFEDGNKRLALSATSIFLRMNGFYLALAEAEAEEVTLSIAKGEIRREEVFALVSRCITPLGAVS